MRAVMSSRLSGADDVRADVRRDAPARKPDPVLPYEHEAIEPEQRVVAAGKKPLQQDIVRD